MIHQTQPANPPTMPTTVFHLLIVAHVAFDPSWTWQKDQKRTKRWTLFVPEKFSPKNWKLKNCNSKTQDFQDVFKFGRWDSMTWVCVFRDIWTQILCQFKPRLFTNKGGQGSYGDSLDASKCYAKSADVSKQLRCVQGVGWWSLRLTFVPPFLLRFSSVWFREAQEKTCSKPKQKAA